MKKSKLEKSRNRWGIVFVLPQLISLICFGIVPIVIAFVLVHLSLRDLIILERYLWIRIL